MMFVWLGVALIVDAVDGPLARAIDVKTVLPRFSGERLDLIIDYLTYVVVPAFALYLSDLLPDPFRLTAAAAMLLSSVFHVADLNSKTEEGYFVGFPAIWNVVLLYLFAFQLPPYVALVIVMLFVTLTFVPILSVHPFRVARLRPLTCAVTLVWIAAAAFAVANPFPSPLWVQVLLVLTAAYLASIGLARSLA
jgi:phosphatidylcholine synthase